MEFLESVCASFVANCLFVPFLILISWSVAFFLQRSKLMRFFGILKSKRISVYLARVDVLPWGAVGTGGQILSYYGPTCALGEMKEGLRFRDLFNYVVPQLSQQPGLLGKLLLCDVIVDLDLSPVDEKEIDLSSSVIAIGGPGFNTATRSILSRFEKLTFSEGGESVGIDGVPPMLDTDYGYVQRIVDRDENVCLFVAAGLSEHATSGAAYYLATEWRQLYRDYRGDKDFLHVVKIDAHDRRNWKLVLRK